MAPRGAKISGGVSGGTIASFISTIEEIKAVREFSHSAKCSYMHTIKSKNSIFEAYFKYGIKTFALDTKDDKQIENAIKTLLKNCIQLLERAQLKEQWTQQI